MGVFLRMGRAWTHLLTEKNMHENEGFLDHNGIKLESNKVSGENLKYFQIKPEACFQKHVSEATMSQKGSHKGY